MKLKLTQAGDVLRKWKGDSYAFGEDVVAMTGRYARKFGKKATVLSSFNTWANEVLEKVSTSLEREGVIFETIRGARPNTPREDVYRISLQVAKAKSDVIVAIGGGSTIDAAKAAAVLNTYSPSEVMNVLSAPGAEADSIEPFLGVGTVTKMREAIGRTVLPVVAVQTAASSAAHLTNYCNITDLMSGEKKQIIDDCIIPPASVFDYKLTVSQPKSVIIDGALDGLAHAWEVYVGPGYHKVREISEPSISLILTGLQRVKKEIGDVDGRTALGMGNDLAGYVVMLGKTNGPHLGSFSLTHVLSHGRACGLLIPYYIVLFAAAIEDQLKFLGGVLRELGYLKMEINQLKGRTLGLALAEAWAAFLKDFGLPTSLREAGATEGHILKMLAAAKSPRQRFRLENMPVAMSVEKGDIDRLMKPLLEAAFAGDFHRIP